MRADKLFEHICRFFGIILIVIVAMIGIMLFIDALPAIRQFGLGFLISTEWDPVNEQFGALPFIYGTLLTSFLALLIALPFSLGVAIFLTEMAPLFIRRVVGFLVEILAAIPSVIYGLWGIFFLIPLMRESVEPWLLEHVGFLPIFSGPPYGIGVLPASIILAIMIIPIISSISRDVLEAVPTSQREAALALGATKWETTWIAVLKYARSGILGAVFLGLGRALGETMAVTMLIGNRVDMPISLFAPAHTMASVIANEFTEATGDLYLSALIGIGLTLFMITLLINAGARLLVWKVTQNMGAHE